MAGNDTENLPVKEVESESVSYLTLGDGDFTYSLDLARYMKLSGSSQTLSPTKPHKNTRLILTGVDTLEALTSKYKDSAFILQDIRNQQDEMPSMSLRIQHGVNAIIHPDEKERAKGPLHECADHVMFHHPHLGTENCSLHKRFLAHLFFSVDRHWMKPKGGVKLGKGVNPIKDNVTPEQYKQLEEKLGKNPNENFRSKVRTRVKQLAYIRLMQEIGGRGKSKEFSKLLYNLATKKGGEFSPHVMVG